MKKIIIVEPERRNIEHLMFNSSVIQILYSIFYDANIVFYADKEHAELIEKETKIKLKKRHLDIKINKQKTIQKVITDFICMLRFARGKPDAIVYLSATPSILLLSKVFLKKIAIYYFFHDNLELLNEKYNIFNYFYWLRPALNIKRNNVAHIVLSESIKMELEKVAPGVSFEAIDLPCHSSIVDMSSRVIPPVMNIGAIGFGHTKKGSHLIFELENLVSISRRVQLHHIGQFKDNKILIPNDTNVKIHGGNRPLCPEEFNLQIEQMYYCIFFYPKHSYKLTASGAIFDALVRLKPVIAMRNAYFEYIFSKMGNIGYLCDSIEEMSIIINTLSGQDESDYFTQQQNIKIGLKKFSVEIIERQMKKIISATENMYD